MFTEEVEELELEVVFRGLGLSAAAGGGVGVLGVGDGVSASFFLRSVVEWRVKREILGLVFVGVDWSLGFFFRPGRAGKVSDSALGEFLLSLSLFLCPSASTATAASDLAVKDSLPMSPTVESERSSFLPCQRVRRRR